MSLQYNSDTNKVFPLLNNVHRFCIYLSFQRHNNASMLRVDSKTKPAVLMLRTLLDKQAYTHCKFMFLFNQVHPAYLTITTVDSIIGSVAQKWPGSNSPVHLWGQCAYPSPHTTPVYSPALAYPATVGALGTQLSPYSCPPRGPPRH